MSAVALAVIGLGALLLGYIFYSKFIAERIAGVRLQRYIVQEWGAVYGISWLTNGYVATGIAVPLAPAPRPLPPGPWPQAPGPRPPTCVQSPASVIITADLAWNDRSFRGFVGA